MKIFKYGFAYSAMVFLMLLSLLFGRAQAATVVCGALSAFNGNANDASGVIQGCINSAAANDAVELPVGKYYVAHQVKISNRPITLRTQGKTSSMVRCGTIANDCAELIAAANFDGFPGILQITQGGTAIDHIVINGNKNARGGSASAANCRSGSNGWGYNMRAKISNFSLTNSINENALCGTGLEMGGTVSNNQILNNLFVSNGVHNSNGLWSDGLTVHDCSNCVFQNNDFVDGTDIDFIFGGCQNCSIKNNTIRHSDSFANASFAGLMLHAWPNTSGNYTGTEVTGNAIDCGAKKRCGFGLYLGAHAWYQTMSYGGSIHDNKISNSQQGLVIDAFHDAQVYNNPVSNVSGFSYTISPDSYNIDHSKDTIGTVFTTVYWDNRIPNMVCQNDCGLPAGSNPVCIPECTAGAKQCSGKGVQTCALAGGCLKWSAVATCASGQSCSDPGICAATCAPKTCTSLGFDCGSVTDGCGGTLSCGACATGKACTANKCVSNQNAQLVSQSVPATMTASQTYPVSVVMKNSGTTIWTEAKKFRLGSQNPQDNSLWGMGRVNLAATDSIAAGSSKIFTFNVKAPATAGTYNFQWQMVQDGVAWFGDKTVNVAVTVTAALPVCVPTCTTANAKQCSGNGVQTCALSGGCLKWGTAIACSTNQTCSSGTCSPNCSNECTSGAKQCDGTTGFKTCAATNGCLKWGAAVNCPANQTCSGAGVCAPTCVSKNCAALGNYECGAANDGCGNTLNCGTCASGKTCTANKCVVSTLARDSNFVSQSVPATMTAGQTYPVTVTMKNTGTATWTAADKYRLGSQNSRDNLTWGTGRVVLAATESIAPGQTKTFTFNAKAPATPGTYNFQWQMLQESVAWFGDKATNVAVTVTSVCTNQCTSGAKRCGINGGAQTCTLSNGCTAWSAEAACLSGQSCDSNGECVATCIPNCSGKNCGDNGCSGTCGICASGQACNSSGMCGLLNTTTNAAQFISQSVPSSMTASQTYPVSVTMKNTGTATWSEAQQYRLGSQNPRDNNTWGASGRISLGPGESIAPGASKTFTFNVKAPATAGTYNFQWQMLREHVQWFGDKSPNVAVAVAAASPVCVPTCTAANSKQCSGNGVQTCVLSGGCLRWSTAVACASGQTCGGNGICAANIQSGFVTVNGDNFYLNGQKWFPYGMNYWPSHFSHDIEPNHLASWYMDPYYTNNISLIEKDLSRAQEIGLNSFWITGYSSGSAVGTTPNFLDFLNRLKAHNLKVGVSMGMCNPFTANHRKACDEMIQLLRNSGATENDTIFAYDLAWEISAGKYDVRNKLNAEWTEWIISRYGSIAKAQAAWGYTLKTGCELAQDATVVSHNIPSKMIAGKTYDVQVSVKNTGISAWKASDSYRLGILPDGAKFSAARLSLGSSEIIAPGQTKVWSFQVTAPMISGTYDMGWKMLQENVAWFGQQVAQTVIVGASEEQQVYQPTQKDVCGPTDSEISDNTKVKMVTAYRRFIDDYVNKELAAEIQDIRKYDTKHLITVRMSGGTTKTNTGTFPVFPDLRYSTAPLDFLTTELYNYALEDGAKSLGFISSYGGSKPMVILEFGKSTCNGQPACADMANQPAAALKDQADYFENVYGGLINSGMKGSFGWFFKGIRPAEKSDYGVVQDNADLGDKPVTLVIENYAARMKSLPDKNPVSWITVDRDAQAGVEKMFQAGMASFATAAHPETLGVKTACTGKTSKDNLKADNIISKCLDANFNSVEIKDNSGNWVSVSDGQMVQVSNGQPLYARISVKNIHEAKWLGTVSAGGGVGTVRIGGNENYGLGFRRDLSQDVPWYGDYQSGEFKFSNGITEQKDLSMQMVSENIAWFGERISVTLVPNAIQICASNAVNGCKVCKADGYAWVDTDSKCASGQTCSAGVCVSGCVATCTTADAKQCDGTSGFKTCVATNGCFKWGAAANCPTGQTCSGAGVCLATCIPSCSGKSCGADGCGGGCGCGTCGSNQACNSGVCHTNSGGGWSSGGGGEIANPPEQQPIAAKPVTQMMRAEIIAKINEIVALIAKLQAQLKAMGVNVATAKYSCVQITKNLFYGMMNDPQVKCLQEVLKSQNNTVAVSGNYDAATKTAVALFQQKYASEILAPYHLVRGSGNVGNATKTKLNYLMSAK